jgi:protein TonB
MIRYLSNIAVLVALNLVPIQSLIAQVKEYPINYIVEEMPLFDNSDPTVSFSRYIQEQVDNLSLQIPDSISGRIDVHFWIDTIGNVVDPEIIRSLNESLDSLACKIVLDSPEWIPGKQRGQTVRVGFTFPVYINMDDSKHTVH